MCGGGQLVVLWMLRHRHLFSYQVYTGNETLDLPDYEDCVDLRMAKKRSMSSPPMDVQVGLELSHQYA